MFCIKFSGEIKRRSIIVTETIGSMSLNLFRDCLELFKKFHNFFSTFSICWLVSKLLTPLSTC